MRNHPDSVPYYTTQCRYHRVIHLGILQGLCPLRDVASQGNVGIIFRRDGIVKRGNPQPNIRADVCIEFGDVSVRRIIGIVKCPAFLALCR